MKNTAPANRDRSHLARTTRRAFVRASALALLAGSSGVDVLGQRPGRVGSRLKSQAQYLGEAADFDSGIRELTQAASFATATEADMTRFLQRVEAAAPKLDRHNSWMVAQCLADSNLVAWVRRTLRDEASARKFIAEVKRNPKAVDGIPGLAALKRQLTSLSEQKRGIVRQIIAKTRDVAGLESSSSRAAARAAEVQACQKTWAIVGAIAAVVVTIVAAVVTAAFNTDVEDLANTYRGTGADASDAALQSATVEYQRCSEAARRLPPAQRQKAIARCLAEMLETKAAWFA